MAAGRCSVPTTGSSAASPRADPLAGLADGLPSDADLDALLSDISFTRPYHVDRPAPRAQTQAQAAVSSLAASANSVSISDRDRDRDREGTEPVDSPPQYMPAPPKPSTPFPAAPPPGGSGVAFASTFLPRTGPRATPKPMLAGPQPRAPTFIGSASDWQAHGWQTHGPYGALAHQSRDVRERRDQIGGASDWEAHGWQTHGPYGILAQKRAVAPQASRPRLATPPTAGWLSRASDRCGSTQALIGSSQQSWAARPASRGIPAGTEGLPPCIPARAAALVRRITDTSTTRSGRGSSGRGSSRESSRPATGPTNNSIGGCTVAMSGTLAGLSDDVLQHTLTYLRPMADLMLARQLCRRINEHCLEMMLFCSNCRLAFCWNSVLVCDLCDKTSCRPCAGISERAATAVISTAERLVLARQLDRGHCKSCGGEMEEKWDSCPWCSTLRDLPSAYAATQQRAYARKKQVKRKVKESEMNRYFKAWDAHPCGHSKRPRRTCDVCTQRCSRCGSAACPHCTWKDDWQLLCLRCAMPI